MKRIILIAGLLLLFLPLLPAAHMRDILPLLIEFPLRTQHVVHPLFSPVIFSVFSFIFVFLLAILIVPRWFGFIPRDVSSVGGPTGRWSLPAWGYTGIIICLVAWTCAWNRFECLNAVNDYTFFPLWLGYILTVDAFVFKRSGTSVLHRTPKMFALLFPASAIAWWYFEYLNRFVQNWWYVGAEDFSSFKYVVLSTLSFSTVFPAVFETKDLLCTFRRFKSVYTDGPKWFTPSRTILWLSLTTGAVSLFMTGLYPSSLFFLTWFAPLIILGSALALAGVESPLTLMRRGDYTDLFTLAVAALICGFFWEMWNFYSMPKWYYSVPYVLKFKIFEMPAPGYGGYLPFGPICWCMWLAGAALTRSKHSTSNAQKPTFK